MRVCTSQRGMSYHDVCVIGGGQEAPVRVKKHGAWLAYLIVGFYFVWWALSMVPVSGVLIDLLSRHIPGWLATLNWGLSLFLIAIVFGPLPLPAFFLVPLYGCLLTSLVFYAVSFHFPPVVSFLVP